jgi:membrane-associated phospholipid phosphatase
VELVAAGGTPMRPADYIINLALSGVLIVGAYQFYFWCQRNPPFEVRELASSLDDQVPYLPRWVWVYSLLYYAVIFYLSLTFKSAEQFTHVASSYLLLLALQVACFLLFPVRTPERWRVRTECGALSERFLALVQRYDAPSNSFPSMHTSVAMLTALHLHDAHGAASFAFPALIGLSCLFTKQHYLVDIPAGAVLGWLAYVLYVALVVM